MSEQAFKIRGMDCAEEIAVLKREVGPLVGGADRLAFDLLNGKMTVRPQDGFAEEELLRVVRRTGMEAVPWREVRQGAAVETLWQRRGRDLLCALSGVFLALGFLYDSYSHGWMDALSGGHDSIGTFPLPTLVFYIAAIVAGGWFIFPKAVFAARKLRPDMNLLMTVAAIGAAVINQWFEAASVTFLFALALLLESWSVGRARRAIGALVDLSPTTARYVCPHDGDIEEKPVENVPVGVTVIVRPGEKVPLDGVVTKGATSINQATITGESAPVPKEEGDEVFAGTINNEGAFEFRSTKPADDTTLARIIRMVEEAQSRRAPTEQWVERFARYYTPAMMLFAVLIAVVPPLFLGGGWSRWFYEALVILVIACPCALVISTPVSIVAGLTRAARNGVLIKGGAYLEAPARLRALALDKTGTLTYGRPVVRQIVALNGHTRGELLERAAALEALSEHPIAQALLRRAREEGVEYSSAESFQSIPGKGAEARINGRLFWIGSHRMLHERCGDECELHDQAEALEDAGHSVVVIGNDDHICGLISVADELRPEAADAVLALKKAGIERVVMLTGDNDGTAKAIAEVSGVDEYRAELLPEDKVRAVSELRNAWRQVGMVGDGVNDAPAMAASSLAIAMGAAGSDAAIETADIALMSDDLGKLPWLLRHSRRTLSVMKQNIVFALGVKAVFIVLALAGMATLWMAIAADMGASLLVIFNALRLLGDGVGRREEAGLAVPAGVVVAQGNDGP
jgi:Cd2+/Zn2+-exporting ATPase